MSGRALLCRGTWGVFSDTHACPSDTVTAGPVVTPAANQRSPRSGDAGGASTEEPAEGGLAQTVLSGLPARPTGGRGEPYQSPRPSVLRSQQGLLWEPVRPLLRGFPRGPRARARHRHSGTGVGVPALWGLSGCSAPYGGTRRHSRPNASQRSTLGFQRLWPREQQAWAAGQIEGRCRPAPPPATKAPLPDSLPRVASHSSGGAHSGGTAAAQGPARQPPGWAPVRTPAANPVRADPWRFAAGVTILR